MHYFQLIFTFVCNKNINKEKTEDIVAQKMVEITGNTEWKSNFEKLILEHHMAAKRLKFNELFEPLYEVELNLQFFYSTYDS